jgi:UDP-N-acetylmuramyl pentapeptide synthase
MKSILKNIVIFLLTLLAKVALKRHKPKIVAITGNVGKTSTKDAIYAVVSRSFKTRKSDKSFNSEIGLPLAILGLGNAWSSFGGWSLNLWKAFVIACFKKDFPEWLVLEVGADHPGDIEKVSKWLHPDIVVLTRMSDVPVHIEFFKNTEEVLKEKMFLAHALKAGGTLVVNSDDLYFKGAVKDLLVKKVFYGTGTDALVHIKEFGVTYNSAPLPLPIGQYAVMKIGDKEEKIEIRYILGNHLMYSVAAAAAVGTILGISSEVPLAFLNFVAPRGRMRLLKGVNSTAIIDDTYNSSPLACAEALKALSNLSIRGRKIAILADMKELGENSAKAHLDIGRLAGTFVHTLITVGEMSKLIADGAREVGLGQDKIQSFDNSNEVADMIREMVRAGDVILVKGSQSMRMERVSKALLDDVFKAPDLLVRQEKEWEKR